MSPGWRPVGGVARRTAALTRCSIRGISSSFATRAATGGTRRTAPFAWRDRLPVARAGLAELLLMGGLCLAATGLLAVLYWPACWVPALLGLFILSFFRNPLVVGAGGARLGGGSGRWQSSPDRGTPRTTNSSAGRRSSSALPERLQRAHQSLSGRRPGHRLDLSARQVPERTAGRFVVRTSRWPSAWRKIALRTAA